MVNQQKGGRRQHWVRRIETPVALVSSVGFALANAHAIYWYYSAMNKVDFLQPWVTVLFAGAFVLASFVLSRGLAHRMQERQERGGKRLDGAMVVVLCIAFLFEAVEISCCFAEAAYSVHYMNWITDGGFSGVLLNVLCALPYVILPISPVLAIGLGCFDVVLHHEKREQSVGGVPLSPAAQSKPAQSPTTSFGVPPQNGLRAPGGQPKPAQSPQNGYRAPVGQPKPAQSPQNGYRAPAAQSKPAQSPTTSFGGPPVDPLATRVFPDPSVTHVLSETERPREARTDGLGSSGQFMPSDEPTLVTQSQILDQSKGGWRSKLPLVGRRQKEEEMELPNLMV